MLKVQAPAAKSQSQSFYNIPNLRRHAIDQQQICSVYHPAVVGDYYGGGVLGEEPNEVVKQTPCQSSAREA